MRSAGFTILLTMTTGMVLAGESMRVWPGLAPGETSSDRGETQDPRPGEDPPVDRVIRIRQPMLDVFPAEDPNGPAILILPGGGFGKVVTNKEGSEAAPWLNSHGISTFVLRYRTNELTPADEPAWRRPLQDAQRALRLIRSKADAWSVDSKRVGVIGFSAGGQVASILHTCDGKASYEHMDAIDDLSCRPDFSMLIYPWRVLDPATGQLLPEIRVNATSPPAFLVHTHDDRSSSLGSVLIYAALKKHDITAELHVFQNGGHGYGMRSVKGSEIGTWPQRASAWLRLNNFGR